MKKADEWKCVFCLEGLWDSNLIENSSVKPVLVLLNKAYQKMKYIYAGCATKGELEFYLKKWTQKTYKNYPILYLAFHGEKHQIKLADGNIELDDLAKILEGKCENKIIVFASCSTLDIDKRVIKSFIKRTKCLAVCGYKSDVDWIKSTAFELLLLEGMQENEFSGRGIKAIENHLVSVSKTFPELDFRIVTNKA